MTADPEPQYNEQFAAPPVQLPVKGFLFDMDGTIVDSTAAVVKHWHSVGNEIGVPPEVILETSHGRRSMDMLKVLAPEKANWEYICHMEGLLPKLHGHEAVEIPGARSLLEQLIHSNFQWAIVTSGTVPLVTGWLKVFKLPTPDHLITAESVGNGKPDPECYLMGLDRLGRRDEAGDVVVVEDSPAGIRAGKAAGCRVIGLVTSHTVEQVRDAGPDFIVEDLSSVRMVASSGGMATIEISNALVTKGR